MPINAEIRKITETIRQAVPAEKIYLFGSYAYGKPDANSDYDFYIIIPEGSMRPIEAVQKAQIAVARNIRRTTPIDIMANTPSKFNIMRDRIGTAEKDIAHKGVLVYDRLAVG